MSKTLKRRIIDKRSKGKFLMDDSYLNGYAGLCGWKATLVYASLCRHADKDQSCFPSIRLLSKKLGISERSVKRGIQALEEWTIIDVLRNRGKNGIWKNNHYVLLDRSVWKPKPAGYEGCGKSPHQGSPSPFSGGPQSPDQGSEVPHKETHIKDISKDITKSPGEKETENLLIESAIAVMKEFSGLPSLDGTEKENRRYALLVITKKIIPLFEKWDMEPPKDRQILLTLKSILNNTDEFHKKNLTSFQYLYRQFGRILPRRIPLKNI